MAMCILRVKIVCREKYKVITVLVKSTELVCQNLKNIYTKKLIQTTLKQKKLIQLNQKSLIKLIQLMIQMILQLVL